VCACDAVIIVDAYLAVKMIIDADATD